MTKSRVPHFSRSLREVGLLFEERTFEASTSEDGTFGKDRFGNGGVSKGTIGKGMASAVPL